MENENTEYEDITFEGRDVSIQNTNKAIKELKSLIDFCVEGNAAHHMAILLNTVFNSILESIYNRDDRCMDILVEASNKIYDIMAKEHNEEDCN
jgi:hypothetical protein